MWFWKSIFQGFIIMTMATTAFDNPFLSLVTITYSSLQQIEFLNVLSAVTYWTKYVWLSIVLSLFCYILSMIYLRSYLNIYLQDMVFVIKIILIAVIAWAPQHTAQALYIHFFPSEFVKIMQGSVSKKHKNFIHKYWRKFRDWTKGYGASDARKNDFAGVDYGKYYYLISQVSL